jgi:AcrR family transcriptional regulator
LCAEADVARKTFYAHYDDVEELARERIADVLMPIFESISDEHLEEPERGGVIQHVLDGMRADMHRVAQLHQAFPAELIMSVLHPVAVRVARRMLEIHGVDDDFLAAYMSSSAASLALSGFRTWMARDFVDDPADIAEFMTTLLGPGTEALVNPQEADT